MLEVDFSKKNMRTLRPEQPNFSDCGIFLLHYEEKILSSVTHFYWPETVAPSMKTGSLCMRTSWWGGFLKKHACPVIRNLTEQQQTPVQRRPPHLTSAKPKPADTLAGGCSAATAAPRTSPSTKDQLLTNKLGKKDYPKILTSTQSLQQLEWRKNWGFELDKGSFSRSPHLPLNQRSTSDKQISQTTKYAQASWFKLNLTSLIKWFKWRRKNS